jgi:outer membrane protein TolC
MEQNEAGKVIHWPLQDWNLNALTLAAFYYNPALDAARASITAADAAIKTAAMKPNPTVGVGSGYSTSPESAWLLAFNFSLPIETAGKRGYRTAAATHLSDAARIHLAETGWAVRSGLRTALVDYLLSLRAVDLFQKEEAVRLQNIELLDRRFRAGEIPWPDVNTARIDLANFQLAMRAAEGQIATNRATLAAAIGVPVAALAGKRFELESLEHPPPADELSTEAIQSAAVLNRLDVRRSLDEYEAAQSNLQLELAKQYPDIDVGPGYSYEESYHFLSFGPSLVLPLRNHNEGPIAEAEAQRKAAGVQLRIVQSTVIADSEKALAAYRAARATLDEADRAIRLQSGQIAIAKQGAVAGETDQLVPVGAELQGVIAASARIQILQQVQAALGALEDAVERPLGPESMPALSERAPRSGTEGHR